MTHTHTHTHTTTLEANVAEVRSAAGLHALESIGVVSLLQTYLIKRAANA